MGTSTIFAKAARSKVPAIVPPANRKILSIGGIAADSFVEAGHERLMGKIWELFDKAVRRAAELIIIGYSLPGTDASSIEILKDFNSPTKKLIIVNRNKAISSRIEKILHKKASSLYSDFSRY